ncbi:MAG: DnaJ domain-containing protein, partial [Phycisphaeraceae bacterium]|nr:DnaJ domain-containing protein [Phycisphaeraceae bacterium]
MSGGRPDYYAVLGVAPVTDAAGIRGAYRTLAARWHPDRNAGDADANAR